MVEVASETLMLRLPLHVVLAMHSSKHGQSLQKAHYDFPRRSFAAACGSFVLGGLKNKVWGCCSEQQLDTKVYKLSEPCGIFSFFMSPDGWPSTASQGLLMRSLLIAQPNLLG